MNPNAPIAFIQQHIKAGRMEEAESLCRAALAQNPKQPELLFLLAQIAETAQRPDAALDLINKALAVQSPPSATAYFARARILQILGHDEPALADYGRVVELAPQHADAWINRGIILNRHGQKEQAIASYEAAIRVSPQASGAYYNLGNTYQEMGKKERAISSFQTALAHLPSGREEKWRATIHEKLATLFSEALEYTRAGEQFRMAIALNPQSAELLKSYGNVLRNQGKKLEAFACYDAALAINPDYAEARWCKAMAHIPLLGHEPQNRDSLWKEIDREFDALDAWFNPQRSADGHKAVGALQPFYLAYQNRSGRELLTKYGRLCSRLMKHWYDRQGFPPVQTIGLGPVRVGIVSSTFHDHSVWRAFVKGWMQHFNPSKIETHIFYFPVHVDAETEWAKSRAASFQTISRNTSATVRVILGKQLDILIYPDIGMDGAILKLASLRLCDVQIASWGHPQTTGLPTIDYYISADDLEPVDAEDHYSEKLIRLPNLGCCYQKLEPPEQPVDGTTFGLKNDIPLLIAPGMSFKYAPENDHVFVDIARRMNGQCQILFFISHDGLSESLRDRLSKAFETAGLDFGSCCRFITWQNKGVFHGLMRQAAVYLDTIGFSGFNTAMQAVECGLPIVTQEGEFMRGRLASGILHRMDLSELVAVDNNAYIDLAVKLVSDPIYRQNLVQKFVEQRGILFEDREPVLALQNELIGLLKSTASMA